MEKQSDYQSQAPYNQEYLAYNAPPHTTAKLYPSGYTEAQRYSPQPLPPGQVVITTTTNVPPQSLPSQPHINYNPRYPPQNVPPTTNWFERNRKNKPQANSIGAATLLFISGGMSWAWSCMFNAPTPFIISFHMRICWFIAAIIGAIISAALIRRVPTKLLYICASILVTMGGIFSLALHKSAAAITVARYADGIGVGLAFVATLVLAGEESVKTRRGMNAATIVAMSFSCGMFVGILYANIYTNTHTTSFTGTQLQGMLSIFYGALSALMSYFLVVESPVYHLLRNEEQQAVDSLRRLQRPFVVTFETYETLEELKRYVSENREDDVNGHLALFKLCLYHGLATLSFSLAMTAAMVYVSMLCTNSFKSWPLIVFGTLRWLGTLIASFIVDSSGRKKPVMIGAIVCGGLAIGVGVIFSGVLQYSTFSLVAAIVYLLFALQFFSGFFISASPVYDSEAYPLPKKASFIAIGFIVEMLVQIIIASCTIRFGPFFITMGVLYIGFFFFALYALPETKHDTLRVAQGKFRSFSARQQTD